MTLDDSDQKPIISQPLMAQPMVAADRPHAEEQDADQDIFLIPAPPPPAWPRVFPSL